MSAHSWIPAYVGLGSNLDDPRARITEACAALAELPNSRFVRASSLYQTPPFGPVAQPEFVNAVAALLTQLSPQELLAALKQIEARMGRIAPIVRWGPRRIDLDLLVYGDVSLEEPDITLPHPGIPERAFVLVPFAEIAPDLLVPRAGRVSMLLGRVDSRTVVRLAE